MIPCSLSREARQCLLEYHWPGNVRELENVAQRLLLYRDGPVIQREDVLRALGEDAPEPDAPAVPSLAQVERAAIQAALDHFGLSLEGKRQAAAALDISLSALSPKIRDPPPPPGPRGRWEGKGPPRPGGRGPMYFVPGFSAAPKQP